MTVTTQANGTSNGESAVWEEVEALRRYLGRLSADVDHQLIGRYELRRPPPPPGLYWKARWLAGRILRSLGAIDIWRRDPWPVTLRQACFRAGAGPLVIWAVGMDRGSLRAACECFARAPIAGKLAPVLVTDVADFAFFSRLGWLVEYVPRLDGEGAPYDERKLRFLAQLYEGAPAIPARALLQAEVAKLVPLLDLV